MAEKEDSDADWVKFNGRSKVWEYFLVKKDKSRVKCKLCKATYTFCSATSNFMHHLTKEHDIKPKDEKPKAPEVRQPSIYTSMMKAGRDSTKKVLARLAAKDRIPFNTIANSQDIR